MKEQPKVAAEAPSKEMLKKSILQKKENFRERLAACLNSLDEAKLSVEPKEMELRLPELGVVTRVPGKFGSPFGIDIKEAVNRNYMLRKQESKKLLEKTRDRLATCSNSQDEVKRSVGPMQLKLTRRESSELTSVPGVYASPFGVNTIEAANRDNTLGEQEAKMLSEKKEKKKGKEKEMKEGKEEDKKGEKNEEKEEEVKDKETDENKVEKKEGTGEGTKDETKDETMDEMKDYISPKDLISEQIQKEMAEWEWRYKCAPKGTVRLCPSAKYR